MEKEDATKDSGIAVVTSLTKKEKLIKQTLAKTIQNQIFKLFFKVSWLTDFIEDGVDQNEKDENVNNEVNVFLKWTPNGAILKTKRLRASFLHVRQQTKSEARWQTDQ